MNQKKTYRIPNEVQTFPPNQYPPSVKDAILCDIVYEPKQGELIVVTSWVQYPSYDFIFGVPHPDNPKSALESGYFEFRDSRNGKKMAIYVDGQEIQDILKGFVSINEAVRPKK